MWGEQCAANGQLACLYLGIEKVHNANDPAASGATHFFLPIAPVDGYIL